MQILYSMKLKINDQSLQDQEVKNWWNDDKTKKWHNFTYDKNNPLSSHLILRQKKVLEYYQKNPSAAASLRGSIYEEKIINSIKQQSKQTKKIISIKEVEKLIKEQHKAHDHFDEDESKKPKKTVKSYKKLKKIRKK